MIDGAEINEGSLSPSGNIDTSPAIPNFSSREDEIKKEEFERIRKRALDVLEYDDYLIRDGEGRTVVNLNKFKGKFESKALTQQIKHRMGPLATRPEYGNKKWNLAIFHTFKDMPVYSEEDYRKLLQGEQVSPKHLIYSPKNAEAALSVDEVRNSDFYMGLWEVGELPYLPAEYPTLEGGNQSGLSMHEAIASCLIFNPQYGDGQRGEDGRLYVNFNKRYVQESEEIRDKETIRRPISGTFFDSWKYYGGPNPGRGRAGVPSLSNSPAKFFLEKCPDMIEKGMIEPESDFTVISKQGEVGSDLRNVQYKGLVTVAGKTYSLGKDYAGDRVYQFSRNMVGILDQDLHLKKVFELDLTPYSEEELKRPAGSRWIVKKNEIHFIDPDQLEGVNEEEGILLSGFKDLLAFSRVAVREGNFNVLNLSVKEQALATGIYRKYKDNIEFHKFLKKYTLNGMRTLMAVEEAQANAELIWEIGEHTNATKLFSDVSDIVSAVTAYTQRIKDTLPEVEQHAADMVAHTIMSFTSKLLLSTGPIMHNDPQVAGKVDVADVISSIRSFKNKVKGMYSHRYGLKIQDRDYENLLNAYRTNEHNPNLEALTLSLLNDAWMRQIAEEDKDAAVRVRNASDEFYKGYSELFTDASETTGDTVKEIDHFKQYLLEKELSGEPIEGIFLDMGCGDGQRITKPMADALGERAQVMGIDRVLPEGPKPENVSFAKGDFTKIPLADSSVNVVTAHWSVINDLAARSLHVPGFGEVARVLKKGGEFYFDVPYLEGGEGSWEEAANHYKREHPDEPYGMIRADFPGGRSKEFYIYPQAELKALLKKSGFVIKKEESWRTESGKPRKVIVAQLVEKMPPYEIAA